jgi:hypothetical protein
MSVDRSYLPFKSAREYQDRKMAKWMGFFLSEHSAALNETGQLIDFKNALSLGEKVLLLNQAYTNKLIVNFNYVENEKIKIITGSINQVSTEEINIRTKENYYLVKMDDLINISLAEAIDSEN